MNPEPCSGRDAPSVARVSGTADPVPGARLLDQHTTVGTLWRREGERVRCFACGHRCLISEGRRGICKVRFNHGSQLRVPFGYVAGVQCDPVEKKPFFHVYPGADALTFGMLGCDFHCGYCQNWITSQALRDPNSITSIREIDPQQLAATGRRLGARLVVSSYNEPLITAEWAVAVFQEARRLGMECAFVSNGNVTPEALEFLRPFIVAYKIDLKGFDDRRYRTLGGTLEHALEGIRLVHAQGLWLEVVTLLVPGFNDSEAEVRAMARFLASVSPDIPWHVTAFHPDYRMTDPNRTTARQLVHAAAMGREEGLRFVYAGNVPGQVGELENTLCPKCGQSLVERIGYNVMAYRLTAAGHCPKCALRIPGLWSASAENPPLQSHSSHLADRRPRPVVLRQSEADGLN
jgi:pyruvate formate lyase activating enzyme